MQEKRRVTILQKLYLVTNKYADVDFRNVFNREVSRVVIEKLSVQNNTRKYCKHKPYKL